MSDAKQPPKVTDAPERPKHGPQVRGHGPMGGMGVQEKAINFGPSLRRLLGTLRPERPRIIAVMVLTSIAVVANVVQRYLDICVAQQQRFGLDQQLL